LISSKIGGRGDKTSADKGSGSINTGNSGINIDIGTNASWDPSYNPGLGWPTTNTQGHFGGSTDDYLDAMRGLYDPALVEQLRAAHVPIDSMFWDSFGTLSPAWQSSIDPYTAMVLFGMTDY